MSRILAKRHAAFRQLVRAGKPTPPTFLIHNGFTTSADFDATTTASENVSPGTEDSSISSGNRPKTRRIPARTIEANDNIVSMLATPTWSVRSLLPPESPTQTITRPQLHHLLRLSALPLPKSDLEEEKLLKSLHAQLHFVGNIQKVDTEGVEPLVRIADETEEGREENTIRLKHLKEVLDKETITGRNKRRRRVRDGANKGQGEDWDVFKTAGETVQVPGSGRYFVVRSGKTREEES